MPDLCFKCRTYSTWKDGMCRCCFESTLVFKPIEKPRCQVKDCKELAQDAQNAAFDLKEARAESELAASRMRSAEARLEKARKAYDEAKDALVGLLDASAKSTHLPT